MRRGIYSKSLENAVKAAMQIKQIALVTVVAVLTALAVPVMSQPLDAEKALAKLKKARPDFQLGPIEKSEVSGLIKTSINDGPAIYLTPDGSHFFAGGLFEVGEDRIVDLAEKAKEGEREAALASIEKEDMIVFGNKKTNKAAIYVFTDVDCYYCQKLHLEVDEINELGIEVRYLAYPRKGLNSPTYRKIASAWCSDDRNQALTDLKAGRNIEENVCEPNPVAEQFELGGKLGVRGTPAMMTEDGRMFPGYMPAKELAKRIGI